MKATLVREPFQVFAGDLRSKLQPGSTDPEGRGGRGGHLQLALHVPHTSTMLLLFSPQDFSHNPPQDAPPSST